MANKLRKRSAETETDASGKTEGVRVAAGVEALRERVKDFPVHKAEQLFGGADKYHLDMREDGMVRVVIKNPTEKWSDAVEAEARATEAENEIEMSFSSELPVLVFGEPEILSHEPGDFTLDRLIEVGAILKNHDPDQIVGVPTKAWTDPKTKRNIVRAKFGSTPVALLAKQEVLVDRTLRGVSVGFVVREWVWLKDENTVYKNRFKGPAWIAAKWEALEVSLTPIPADPSVGVNRQQHKEDAVMTEEERKAKEKADREAKEAADRAAAGTAPATTPLAVVGGGADAQRKAEEDARKAERGRITAITTACRTFKVEDSVRDAMIAEGTSEQDANTRILRMLGERQQPVGATVVIDGRAKFARSVCEGIQIRSGTLQRDKAEHGGNVFANRTLIELARECLIIAGEKADRFTSPVQLIERAMRSPRICAYDLAAFERGELIGGGTSDFPYILAATANKVLLASYRTAAVTWRQWCKKGSLGDFKTADRIQLSEAGDLELVGELGAYKAGFFSDKKETIRLAKYGKKYGISYEALINDDMDALSTIPQKMGRAAARKPNTLAVTVLLSNPTMNADSAALFSSTHANLNAETDYALDTLAHAESGIKNLVKLLRGQTSYRDAKESGSEHLNISPRVLLTGHSQEFIARQALRSASALADNKNAGVTNPIAEYGIVPVIEPDIENTGITGYSSTQYYLFGDPSEFPVVEVAFLNGNEEPYMEEVEQTDIDGRIWKIRLECVAGVISYVGAVKETGVDA